MRVEIVVMPLVIDPDVRRNDDRRLALRPHPRGALRKGIEGLRLRRNRTAATNQRVRGAVGDPISVDEVGCETRIETPESDANQPREDRSSLPATVLSRGGVTAVALIIGSTLACFFRRAFRHCLDRDAVVGANAIEFVSLVVELMLE